MRGNVYKMLIKYDTDWAYYHLLVLDIFKTIPYGSCDTAAECSIMETGARYQIYTDVLQREGVLV